MMLISGLGMAWTPGFNHQRDQFGDVVIVHRMHRRQVRPGNPALKPQSLGFVGEGFDMAAVRIVAFIAMHVYHQPAFGRDLAQEAHAFCPVRHGAFEMRNTTNNIHPQIQCAHRVRHRGGVT